VFCSSTSNQVFTPLWTHFLVSLSAQVFCKILRLRHQTLIHRGEGCKDFLEKKNIVISFLCMLNSISMAPSCCRSYACVYVKYVHCCGPKNSVQFLSIDIQCSVLFHFNGFTIKKFALGVLFVASFIDLTPLIIGMVR
jgi:hypothetical protein